ncbi:unnamed protein product [Rotaria sp. Silwood1]|nr:unnamed protein product [Rotaria sp. Silwood1]
MYKSTPLDSLNLPTTSTMSVLTSTANPEVQYSSFSKLARRMAIIPTPNRPARSLTSAKVQSCINENTSITNTNTTTDKHLDSDDSKKVSLSRKQESLEQLNIDDNQSVHEDHNKEEDDEDNLFDRFICENFVPFSGIQPIDQWLDETEMLFHRFKISRKLRLKAVPLLVQGEAKRKYIKNRRSISSFDDFYEFLLTHFDTNTVVSSNSQLNQVAQSIQSVNNQSYNNKSSTDLTSSVVNNTNSILMSQSCLCSSNKVIVKDTTELNGDVSESKLTGNNSSTDNTSLNSVVNDLRKAILTDFIKNPKIFRGNKNDVIKWLEEIDHLMQIAHVPECNRLDLISYSLRGDALQWYRNNRSTLTSWSLFVQEIKKAFTSSFCEELAFKTLESYTQSANQSVRNFYNEVIKLCKQADPSMSESTKLKNLLNKVKPSIQLEVRKKKPKTTVEFLEYAKEVEELLQLSSTNIDTHTNYDSKPTNIVRTTNASSNLSSYYSSNSNNNNYRSTPYRNSRTNTPSYTSASHKSDVGINSRTQPSNSNYQFQPKKYTSLSQNRTNTTNSQKQKNIQQYTNTSKNDSKTSSRSVNAVISPPLSSDCNNTHTYLSSIVCQICNQLGHDASSCPSFQ